jgi:hypothetical protein
MKRVLVVKYHDAWEENIAQDGLEQSLADMLTRVDCTVTSHDATRLREALEKCAMAHQSAGGPKHEVEPVAILADALGGE